MSQRTSGIIEDLSGAVVSFNTSASEVAADVHAMSVSIDRWLKIITGVLIGFGVVWVGSKVIEGRRGRR